MELHHARITAHKTPLLDPQTPPLIQNPNLNRRPIHSPNIIHIFKLIIHRFGLQNINIILPSSYIFINYLDNISCY